MYTDFFNLTDRPFDLTASPRFLYLGDVHREALAFLSYGVLERKGFILLTGEVGTGKTTMVRSLLDSLNENVECVYLSNPLLSSQDFINYLASSVFKREMLLTSKAEFLIVFEEFLRKCLDDRKTFVLIVDDAQRLSFDLLGDRFEARALQVHFSEPPRPQQVEGDLPHLVDDDQEPEQKDDSDDIGDRPPFRVELEPGLPQGLSFTIVGDRHRPRGDQTLFRLFLWRRRFL